jgi:hypothetical protein
MVAGAQAMAVARGRQVQAWTSPSHLVGHAGISDNRCGALRGGSSGGVLFAHSAHLESKICRQKRGKQICPWFHGGYGVVFLARARQKSDEDGIGTCLRGYLW